ncbi:MAG: DNA translocase SpoIIIE [Verrucomicrobia subdivision 3 bacterium]|nr:DNA translocase SpoIIIE [Limisphaerales bacterium]MCS1413420.1 DNA translocase SpoIIIE [Limisphaerales bacterium]
MARKKATQAKVEERGWGDILGILYISFAVLLFGALVSYDAGDLASNRQPPNEVIQNLMGRFGAWAGSVCFFIFGGAAFVLPVLLLGFGLAHYVPILNYLLKSWRARLASLGLVLSCMGMLDLYSDSLIWLQSAISSKGAGGFIGHILNDYFFVYFFNEMGAITLYLTVYAASLVAFTNFDVVAFLTELWERYQDRRERIDKDASIEERKLRRQERKLAKEARQLQTKVEKPGAEEEEPNATEPKIQPLPEPTVRDHSITSSPPKQHSQKDSQANQEDEIPIELSDDVGLGETIPAEEVTATITEDILGRSPAAETNNSASDTGAPDVPEPVMILPPPSKKASKSKQKRALAVAIPPVIGNYSLPTIDALDQPDPNIIRTDSRDSLMANAKLMQSTLAQFGIDVALGDITKGPTITRYELHPAPGIKLERISNLSNNITAALKAEHINILAPVPGKGSVGIEIPNVYKTKVIIRDLLESEEWARTKARLPLVLGKDVYGKPIVVDLAEMPHLLIAGSTGSGKSVCINAIIASLLYRYSPEDLRFVMIDPKVVELQQYNSLPHLVVPVVTDPKKVVLALRWVVNEMEKRYQIFAKVGVRNIKSFNERPNESLLVIKQTELDPCNSSAEGEEGEGFAVEIDEEIIIPREEEVVIPEKLSYIVVVIDELADLMLVAPSDVEMAIARITQMARAAGIHCIVATQRPSVDVITGVIKANIPARIAFQVASKTDSRTILDSMGADKLLGKGDMLYLPPGSAKLIRAQGVLITDEEIQKIVDHIGHQGTPSYETEIHEQLSKSSPSANDGDSAEDEELIEKCIDIIRCEQKASVSLMQRRLRIGYTRAARIMDEIEDRGIVGPSRGAEPREILIDLDGTGADGHGLPN